MTHAQLNPVLHHVRRLAGPPPGPAATDAQLLRRFAADRDEAAFAALVERHGRLVFGVCRRVLGNHHDAEDAFQATFLVLARHAGSIHHSTAVGSWLYRVAHRIAVKAGADRTRQRVRERQAGPQVPGKTPSEVAYRELQGVLQEELGRLPEKYRAPFILCCLEGHSGAEAAELLGWKAGTVTGRLSTARRLLQQRLARRGVLLSAALAVALASRDATAAVPLALARQAVRLARPGAAAPRVAALAEGAVRALLPARSRLAAVVVLAVGLAAGAGVLTRQALAARQDAPPAAEDRPAVPSRPAVEALPVTGRVLGPDGRPLAGVRLSVWTTAAPAKGALPVQTMTGADGRFRLGVPRADLNRDAHLVAAAPECGPDWADLADLTRGGELTLRLVPDDVPIRGRIRDLEGRPVAGATVRVVRVEQADLRRFVADKKTYRFPDSKRLDAAALAGPTSVTTDGDGRFRLSGFGRDRVVLLELRGPGLANNSFDVLTRTEPVPGMTGGNFGTYVADFEHLAEPSRPIVGTVRDRATGRPVAGVSVGSLRYERVVTRTDAQGHYRIEGAGKHRDYLLAAGGSPYFQATKLHVPDTQGLEPITADFELERGVAVTGRLTDGQTGRPVRGHVGWVALADNPHLKDFTSANGPEAGFGAGVVGPDGSFTVVAVPGPGLLLVRADDADRYPAAKVGGVKLADPGLVLQQYHALVRIDPSEADPKSRTCDIVLEPGRAVAGTVTDPDGRPLVGVVAAGLSPLPPSMGEGARKLGSASFTVRGLRPGEPRVLLFLEPEKRLGKVEVVPGHEAGPLTVRLELLGTLTGRVVDAGGRPWAGLKVTARYNVADLEAARVAGKDEHELPWELLFEYGAWQALLNREVTTDAEGRFRLDGLVPGLKYDVAAKTGEGQGTAVVAREALAVEPGKVKELGDLPGKERPEK